MSQQVLVTEIDCLLIRENVLHNSTIHQSMKKIEYHKMEMTKVADPKKDSKRETDGKKIDRMLKSE